MTKKTWNHSHKLPPSNNDNKMLVVAWKDGEVVYQGYMESKMDNQKAYEKYYDDVYDILVDYGGEHLDTQQGCAKALSLFIQQQIRKAQREALEGLAYNSRGKLIRFEYIGEAVLNKINQLKESE